VNGLLSVASADHQRPESVWHIRAGRVTAPTSGEDIPNEKTSISVKDEEEPTCCPTAHIAIGGEGAKELRGLRGTW